MSVTLKNDIYWLNKDHRLYLKDYHVWWLKMIKIGIVRLSTPHPSFINMLNTISHIKKDIVINLYISKDINKSFFSNVSDKINIHLIKVHKLYLPKNWGALPLYAIDKKHLNKIVNDNGIINVVELFLYSSYQIIKLAKKYSKSTAVSIHSVLPYHECILKFPPYNIFLKRNSKLFDIGVAQCHATKKYTRSLNISDSKIKVIYWGLDLDRFSPNLNDDKTETIKILFVGRLIEYKGIRDLLIAFSNIIKNYKNVELIVCGDGPLRRIIYKFQRKIKFIKFYKWIEYNNIHNVFKNADIFCLPSKTYYLDPFKKIKINEEQFSLAKMEAMASGLPCIVTNIGGLPELLPKGNIIVNENSIKELQDGLLYFIENEKERKKIGKKNIQIAEKNFDLITQSIKLLNALLGDTS